MTQGRCRTRTGALQKRRLEVRNQSINSVVSFLSFGVVAVFFLTYCLLRHPELLLDRCHLKLSVHRAWKYLRRFRKGLQRGHILSLKLVALAKSFPAGMVPAFDPKGGLEALA